MTWVVFYVVKVPVQFILKVDDIRDSWEVKRFSRLSLKGLLVPV